MLKKVTEQKNNQHYAVLVIFYCGVLDAVDTEVSVCSVLDAVLSVVVAVVELVSTEGGITGSG